MKLLVWWWDTALLENKTASDVNVLFSTQLVCASLSALCQLTLNDKSRGFKDAKRQTFYFSSVSDSAMGFAGAYSCELFYLGTDVSQCEL